MADKERLITIVGFKKLQSEHDFYWKKLRPETVQRVADAAAEGDRSENAEYIYGRKKLRDIDRRLRYLSQFLDRPRVVDPAEVTHQHVAFGATVHLEDEDENSRVWTIVSEGEADSREGMISEDAPLAKALMGKRAGDEIEFELEGRHLYFEIVGVDYGGETWQRYRQKNDAAGYLFTPENRD